MSDRETNTKLKSPLFFAAIGFVIGALAVGLWSFEKNLPSLGEKSQNEENTPAPNNVLVVENQDAGKTVVVHSVAVPPPGVWVAVEELSDGTLIGVLGAARVRFQSTNVMVELLRETKPGSEYVAVLYRDDGDDQFSLEKDSVYIDFDSGQRIETSFKTNP